VFVGWYFFDYRALFIEYKALLIEYRAVLLEYRALWIECRALWIEYWPFFSHIGLFCVNTRLFDQSCGRWLLFDFRETYWAVLLEYRALLVDLAAREFRRFLGSIIALF